MDFNTGNVAFMVVTTVLVFMMTPGLAFFYGGLVPRKHALTMMNYSFISIGVVTVLWVMGGFSLVFGDDIGGVIGSPFTHLLFRDVTFAENPAYGSTIPFLMFFMYQLMFAIITAPLMTGAIASRITLTGWIKVLIMWMILVYFPVAHWVWGEGFLSQLGFVDYAGGTVIHVTAGFAALVGVLFFGKRANAKSENEDVGSMNLMLIGASLLFIGWFGFNSGGALEGGNVAAIAFTNTGVAGAFAMMTWVMITYFKTQKFSLVEMMTGAVAGLATITPCSGYVRPMSAVLIGILAAIICYNCLVFTRKKKWDDALGVWGVHGMGGLSGSIMIGIFAEKQVDGIEAGIHQLGVQILGVAIVLVYTVILTALIFRICDRFGSTIRVADRVQRTGLDEVFEGEED